MSLNIRPFRALRAKNHLVKKVIMPAFDNLNADDISKIKIMQTFETKGHKPYEYFDKKLFSLFFF